MVWTLHIAHVFLCAISKFLHFSWFPNVYKFAKEHHPFDKGLGHNTNILLIVILCISSLIVILLKSMQLWQKVTHIVWFHFTGVSIASLNWL